MATPWPIGDTRSGYCAATDGEEPGDCATGESGSWSVASGAVLAPQVLVAQRVLTGEHPTAPVAAQAIPVGVDM